MIPGFWSIRAFIKKVQKFKTKLIERGQLDIKQQIFLLGFIDLKYDISFSAALQQYISQKFKNLIHKSNTEAWQT